VDLLIEQLEHWLWPSPASQARAPLWRRVARYAFALLRDFVQGDLSLRAMSLGYTTMLTIVPLLAFAFAVLKGLGIHRELEPLLLNFLMPLGPRGAELTQRVVGLVDNVSGSALASISIVILLFSMLSMAQKVESSLNFVWRVDRPRSFARRFTEYLSVMFVGPLLMTVAMSIIATLASATATSFLRTIEPFGFLLARLSALAPYAMVVAGFTFLYMFVPNTRVRVVPALIGGAFGGIVWAGSGNLFTSLIVSLSRTEAIYSSFAIVIIAMLWLHLSWLVLLLGAQLACYAQNPDYLRLGQRTESLANAVRERLALSTMLLVGRDFTTPGHGWRLSSLAAEIRVPRHLLEPVLISLTNAGLLTETNEHRLIPAKDPRHIDVSSILDAVRVAQSDRHGVSDDWNPTVGALADSIDRAIHDSLHEQTLADIVDTDARRAAVAAAEEEAAARTKQPKADGPPPG
jgi:membrane protein